MNDTVEYAIQIAKMSDTELLKKRADIFNSLLAAGIDANTLIDLCSITIELTLRGTELS